MISGATEYRTLHVGITSRRVVIFLWEIQVMVERDVECLNTSVHAFIALDNDLDYIYIILEPGLRALGAA